MGVKLIELKQLAEVYKALSDENRLKIILKLAVADQCVCEIQDQLKDLSQPAVSHHLRILKQAKLVTDSREGKWIYYSLNRAIFNDIIHPLQGIVEGESSLQVRTSTELCEQLTKKHVSDGEED